MNNELKTEITLELSVDIINYIHKKVKKKISKENNIFSEEDKYIAYIIIVSSIIVSIAPKGLTLKGIELFIEIFCMDMRLSLAEHAKIELTQKQ